MPNTFYATNNFTGDGTTTIWNINFSDGYLSTANVKARYTDTTTGEFVDIPVTNVSGNVVTISPAQPAGRVFSIYRDTRKQSPLVDFNDGAILNELNLDTMARQAIMVAAESADLATGLVFNVNEAQKDADEAKAAADAAQDTANDAIGIANGAAGSAAAANASATAAANSATQSANAAAAAQASASQSQAAVARKVDGGVQNNQLRNLGELFPAYTNQDPTSIWYTSCLTDVSNAFNQGPWSATKAVIAPYLQEIQFRFWDMTSSTGTFTPSKVISSSEWVLPLCGIESTMHENAIGINPFRASEIYGNGIATFRYEGSETAHALLRGSIKVMMRISANSPETRRLAGGGAYIPPTLWLTLGTPNGTPTYEARSRYSISANQNWFPQRQFKLYSRADDKALPAPDYASLTTLLSAVTPISHTVAAGIIDANSVQDTLTPTAGTFTTSWMTVGGETMWHVALVGGTSNISRLQYKNAAGQIWYDSAISSGTASSAQVFKLHPEAVQARFTFHKAGDTATDVVVKAVPGQYDQFAGTWTEFEFYVNQMVTFEPGFDYNFTLAGFSSQGNDSIDQNSFLVATGGLSILYNARPQLFSNFDKLYKGN